MPREDWYWLGWHLIKREVITPQWGVILWNYSSLTLTRQWTLDVWVGKTMWTVRRARAI